MWENKNSVPRALIKEYQFFFTSLTNAFKLTKQKPSNHGEVDVRNYALEQKIQRCDTRIILKIQRK